MEAGRIKVNLSLLADHQPGKIAQTPAGPGNYLLLPLARLEGGGMLSEPFSVLAFMCLEKGPFTCQFSEGFTQNFSFIGDRALRPVYGADTALTRNLNRFRGGFRQPYFIVG
jgi:hypothetical protein